MDLELQFENGMAIVSKYGTQIAQIYDRRIYYPANKITVPYKLPFTMDIKNVGHREFSTLEECIKFVKKYLY